MSHEKGADVSRSILVTGATGFVGRLLVRQLRELGYPVRCMSRSLERLRQRFPSATEAKLDSAADISVPPPSGFELVEADVFSPETIRKAIQGIDTAYYLVHSLEADEDCWERDRNAAANFVEVCESAGVRRIIYLGGLGRGPNLSQHLQSRQEVGRILASSSVECVEIRAAVVIGTESFSFQLIAKLTRRLPIMLCPKWVETKTQPIAVEDVIRYLVLAADLPPADHRVLEVGGADVVSYGDMIREYARLAGLHRTLVPIPILTPFLSSLWLGLVTPASRIVGRHLIEGLRNPTTVEDDTAERLMNVNPMGITQAMQHAMSLSQSGEES